MSTLSPESKLGGWGKAEGVPQIERAAGARCGLPQAPHDFTSSSSLAIGLLLTLAGPFLAGRVYTADDLGAFHLPMRAFYADCLAHGEAFDWSPQMYGGFYLTGEGQIGGYHPLHLLLYRCLPLPIAFDLECLLSYPFMLLGMYLLLRRWDIRRDAALFGSLAFTFSGFALLHFVHVNGVAVVAHIPWLLLAIHATLFGTSRKRWLTCGIGIALLTASQLLLGYPQYVWLSMLVELGYLLMLIAGFGDSPLSPFAPRKSVAFFRRPKADNGRDFPPSSRRRHRILDRRRLDARRHSMAPDARCPATFIAQRTR